MVARLKSRFLSNTTGKKLPQFKAGSVRQPSNPDDFARFVADVNSQLSRVAERFAEVSASDALSNQDDFVTKDELGGLLSDIYVDFDQSLTSEGADSVGPASDDVTSEGEADDDTDTTILDDVDNTGIVFGTDDGSGSVGLDTDSANLFWNDTNKYLGASALCMIREPTIGITVPDGYSAIVAGDYEIASGTALDLESNSVMEIL